MSTKVETITSHFCDRCKEKVFVNGIPEPRIKGFGYTTMFMASPNGPGPSLTNGDLCPGCTTEFLYWMNKKPDWKKEQ